MSSLQAIPIMKVYDTTDYEKLSANHHPTASSPTLFLPTSQSAHSSLNPTSSSTQRSCVTQPY